MGLLMENLNLDVSPSKTSNLFPALVETFGLILIGFLAGKLNLISSTETKGLNTFTVFFALPALIFSSLITLELSNVNWSLITAIFIAKGLVFLATLIGTLVAIKPVDSSRAGIYAIFTTQSNDLALGYPILASIYKETHPQLPVYLYLLAPISLLILNPIGFLCLEVGRRAREADNRLKVATLLGRVLQNPVVIATLLGMLGNWALRGHLPNVMAPLLQTMGNAFAGTALFLLGLRMNGSEERSLLGTDHNKAVLSHESLRRVERGTRTFLVPCLLILVKVVVLPFVCREIVSRLAVVHSASMTMTTMTDFAFLYGAIPTAPSVFVFATMYEVQSEIIAKAMVGATMAAAPILFISAKLLSVNGFSPDVFIDELDVFVADVAIVGLVAATWVLFVLLVTRKWLEMPHFITLCLLLAQSTACIGALLWSYLDCTQGWKLFLQFSLFAGGVFASRILTAVLAVVLGLLQQRPEVITNNLDKKQVVSVAFGLPFLIVLALLVFVDDETVEEGRKMNPNFQYGRTQALVSLVLLVVCFVITIVATLMTQRCRREEDDHRADDQRRLLDNAMDIHEDEELRDDEHEQSVSEASMRRPTRSQRCVSETSENRAFLQAVYEMPVNEASHQHQQSLENRGSSVDERQIFKHLLLLLPLVTSMFVGLALCLWTVVMDRLSGIYVELVFVDVFLNLGQSVFVLFIFGFDVKYIWLTLKNRFISLMGNSSLLLSLPPMDSLGVETRHVCHQFVSHHLESCKLSIVQDVDGHETRYAQAFFGHDLVEWILEVGLAQDRVAALQYGRHLVAGRVVRHVNNNLDFYDDFFLYTFRPLRR